MSAKYELGKAYVQIIPSADGISGNIQSALDPEMKKAGESAGSKIGGAIKKAVVALGIGKIIGDSLNEGGKLQQSLGGIETLYKDSASKMKQYASEAFKTAGLSANEYMENVTSFSAGLIASMGGDTEKAAEVANRAMIDMADNSNKMGTSMELIQNAYQGFAKQNYTMLDNLKLGYGGTQSEMERLLQDATKLTGVKYDISSLSDVYTAIGVIQDNLEITGTTALEGSKTFSGSMNAMKAAAKDFIGNLALGEDVSAELGNLLSTTSTFIFGNFIPMLMNIFKSLPTSIINLIQTQGPSMMEAGANFFNNMITGIREKLPEMVSQGVDMIANFVDGWLTALPNAYNQFGEILNHIVQLIIDITPTIFNKGLELIKRIADSFVQNWPLIQKAFLDILNQVVGYIVEYGPKVLSEGLQLIGQLALGLISNLPSVISSMVSILTGILSIIARNMPTLAQKGLELMGQLAIGLVKSIPTLVGKIPSIIGAIIRAISGMAGQFVNIGFNLLLGLGQGIANAVGSVISSAINAVGIVVNSVKNFFGIHSPSRLFRDEIGAMLPAGMAIGIDTNAKLVDNAMEDLNNTAYSKLDTDLNLSYGQSSLALSSGINNNQPAYINLNLGGTNFKTFVENISNEQNKTTQFELAY